MSDCMTQEDAERMDASQAVQILKPLRDMMLDQHGCPISDAYFALGKAIEALKQQTVGAVPVVRCRDCKHRYDDGYCEVWGDSFYYWEEFDEVPEDMFCGHGERRENETAD